MSRNVLITGKLIHTRKRHRSNWSQVEEWKRLYLSDSFFFLHKQSMINALRFEISVNKLNKGCNLNEGDSLKNVINATIINVDTILVSTGLVFHYFKHDSISLIKLLEHHLRCILLDRRNLFKQINFDGFFTTKLNRQSGSKNVLTLFYYDLFRRSVFYFNPTVLQRVAFIKWLQGSKVIRTSFGPLYISLFFSRIVCKCNR